MVEVFFVIILVGILAFSANCITGFIVHCLNEKLKDALSKKTSYRDLDPGTLDRLEFYKEKEIKFIKDIFGCVEILFFFACAFFLLKFENKPLEIAKNLVIIASGWMAIKVVGNFKNWEKGIEGRIVYAIFLLGSIMSISLGIGLAVLINYLLLCSIKETLILLNNPSLSVFFI